MAQVKARFYLPLQDNDGRDLRAEIDDVETEVGLLFRGWTLLGTVKGMFVMADKTPVFDELAAYEVVMDDTRVTELESVLLAFKAKTTQEAIYLEVQYNTDVRFL
jgi:hypothetical protein